METTQEGEKEGYVYKKWWTRRKRRTREKVWIMLSWLDLALGFFPLPEMTVSVMWTNSSGQINMKTCWSRIKSLSLTLILQLHNFS